MVRQDRLPGEQITMGGATLEEMVYLGFTDKEVAQLYECTTKTVYRRGRRLSLPKYPEQYVTPGVS
jgi:hypothetical protein